MAGRRKPISRSGRLILSGCVLLVSVVLGLSGGVVTYQVGRDGMRASALVGAVLCGPGQRLDDVPGMRRARRLICRDAHGREVKGRFVALNLGLPFILILAVPALWFIARADIRERRDDGASGPRPGARRPGRPRRA